MKLAFKIILLSAALVFCLGPYGKAWADGENPGDYLHTRTYFGIEGTSVSVDHGGAFTGLNYSRIDYPYEIDLIPALDQNFGFGLLIGHREQAWAAEASYWQSNHNATFGPGVVGSDSGSSVTLTQKYQDKAVYNSINVDFKRYFLTETQLQPFINLGVSFPWIVVQNAAIDSNGDTTKLTLAGLGLNLGVGVEYYLSPNLSVFCGGYERWASFDEFKGFALQFNQLAQYGKPTTDAASGLIFNIGTSVGFE